LDEDTFNIFALFVQEFFDNNNKELVRNDRLQRVEVQSDDDNNNEKFEGKLENNNERVNIENGKYNLIIINKE